MSFSFAKLSSNTIPVGIYKATITDLKLKPSKNGETQNNLEIRMSILEGPEANKNLMDTIYEKAQFRLKPFFDAAGVDIKREFSTLQELYQYGINNAKNKVVMIEVGIRTYQGENYNEIKSYKAVASSTTTTAEVLDEFNTDPNLIADKVTIAEVAVEETAAAPVIDFNVNDVI